MNNNSQVGEYLEGFEFGEKLSKPDNNKLSSFDNEKVCKKIWYLLNEEKEVLFDKLDKKLNNKTLEDRINVILGKYENYELNLKNISDVISKITSIKPLSGKHWYFNGFNEVSLVIKGFLEKRYGEEGIIFKDMGFISRTQDYLVKIKDGSRKIYYYCEDSYHNMTFSNIEEYIKNNLKNGDIIIISSRDSFIPGREYNSWRNLLNDYEYKFEVSHSTRYVDGTYIVIEIIDNKVLKYNEKNT